MVISGSIISEKYYIISGTDFWKISIFIASAIVFNTSMGATSMSDTFCDPAE